MLQLLIEEVTGKPFAVYMQQAVFEPLGMSRTTFHPPSVSGPEVATPYDEDGAPLAPYRLVGEAAGGLYSSAEDFARILAAYSDAGRDVVSESSFEVMLNLVTRVEIEGLDLGEAEYGFGHAVHRTDSGERLVYHSGGNPGYLAYFIVAPERGDGIVIVSNGSNAVPVIAGVLQSWSDHYGFDLPPLY